MPARKSPQDQNETLSDVLVPLARMQANDNEAVVAPQQPEARMFEMPAAVWRAMIACYAVFLLALLGATGGAHAAFAIVISVVYVAMFFGTAKVMLRQSPPQPRCGLDRRDTVLQTAFGPLTRGEVYAQVLIVPVGVALFGIAIAIVSVAGR
ncbi:hypothetical protein [Roseibium sp.]|uniref:hypothetical protein n=1 Tax=Roseibium sp. TaxID=1936156 RepID=UPI003299CD43